MSENKTIKQIVLNLIVGVGFFVTSILITSTVGSMFGTQLRGTVSDIGTAIGTGSLSLVALIIVGLLINGFLVWFWSRSRVIIGEKMLGMESMREVKFEASHIKSWFFAFIAVGLVTSIVMVEFGQLLTNADPNNNLVNPLTILNAIGQYDLILLVKSLILIMVLGAIVTLLGHLIYPIQHKLPKPLQ